MLNPSLTDQLAQQRIAELHAAARREVSLDAPQVYPYRASTRVGC